MKTSRWIFLLFFILFGVDGRCDIPLHFQFVFGPNPARAKNMKSADLFNSQLAIDFAEASIKGDTNRMQSLIADGVDVNDYGRKGMTPLFWALINKSFHGFKFLLNHGADPDAVVAVKQPPSENALTLAASLDESEYLQELLTHGAKPNSTVGVAKQTAIFTAAFHGKTNNISILLRSGADIDWKTTGGTTPMHQAIEGNSFGTALFLYRAGANPLIKDKWGYNSIDTIKKFGDKGVVSHADKKAYKQLVEEFRSRGLIDKSDGK